MAESKTRVFVSYSWDVEETTKIVDKLAPLCEERGIELIRDRDTIKYGNLISKFMKELVENKHIITVL